MNRVATSDEEGLITSTCATTYPLTSTSCTSSRSQNSLPIAATSLVTLAIFFGCGIIAGVYIQKGESSSSSSSLASKESTSSGANYYAYQYPSVSSNGGTNLSMGWDSTNQNVRFWNIAYDVLTLRGEPKHGLWKWTEPDANVSFWWCEMGGAWSGEDGFIDIDKNQFGMNAVFENLPKGDEILPRLGPLAKRAMVDNIALALLSVTLSYNMGGRIWLNDGNDTHPYWSGHMPPEDTEIYVLAAYYGWPFMFNGTACTGDRKIVNNTCDSLIHTFIVVVLPEEEEYIGRAGLTSHGLHYEQHTICPDLCGVSDCVCDAVLVDLLMQGSLNKDPMIWTNDTYALPQWALDVYPCMTGPE